METTTKKEKLYNLGIEQDSDRGLVSCPICKENFIHFEKPRLEEGNDQYNALNGVVRGDGLVIPMWCENEHNFEVCFGFHKGCTYVFCRESKPTKSSKGWFREPSDTRANPEL
jgi:hypothetical protein